MKISHKCNAFFLQNATQMANIPAPSYLAENGTTSGASDAGCRSSSPAVSTGGSVPHKTFIGADLTAGALYYGQRSSGPAPPQAPAVLVLAA